jgi:hypothetical protein
MVKAIKRKEGFDGKKLEKKTPKEKKIGQIVILAVMALIVIGFTLNIPTFADPAPVEPDVEPEPEYGVGISTGIREGNLTELPKYKAIFGQLNVALDLSTRIGGDLYLLDGGVSHLILTDASTGEIEDQVSGNYIIYDIAFCGDFDCLVKDGTLPNGTLTYDVYELDSASNFLKSTTIGFLSTNPIAINTITI